MFILTITAQAQSQVYQYKLQDVPKWISKVDSNTFDNFQNVEYTNVTFIVTKNHTVLKSNEGTLKFKNKNSKFFKQMGFVFKPEGICGYVVSSKKLKMDYSIDLWIENGHLEGLISHEKDGVVTTFGLIGNVI